MDKTRRSIEDTGPGSTSCNTSPDSGINNIDSSRFLSSSSSSSQLDSMSSNIHKSLTLNIKTTSSDPIESPPLSDVGVPRTPSPSSPPSSLMSQSHLTTNLLSPTSNQNSLKIPLKYQRQSKSSSFEKHYKKKFRERTWEYEMDKDMDDGVHGGGSGLGGQSEMELMQNHKSSKFRPKGKEWRDWNNEYKHKKKFDYRSTSPAMHN